MEGIIILLTQNLTPIILDKIRLYKISKYDGWLINKKTFIENGQIETLKKEVDEGKIKVLLPFIKKLEDYIDEINLKTAYRNLKNVSIKKLSKGESLIFCASGLYDAQKNEISFEKASLGHEFLHMCSSYFNEETNEKNIGFEQQKGITYIGKGLNEGYTELLTSRIYNKNDKVTSYLNEVKIAKLFELFFDNPNDMEKFYFNHDLPGFIHYMEQFAPKQEIVDIILKLDSASFVNSGPTILPTFQKFIDIQLKLYKLYSSKIKDEVKLQQFKDLICENKIISMVLNKQNMKLTKCNFHTDDLLATHSDIDKSK